MKSTSHVLVTQRFGRARLGARFVISTPLLRRAVRCMCRRIEAAKAIMWFCMSVHRVINYASKPNGLILLNLLRSTINAIWNCGPTKEN